MILKNTVVLGIFVSFLLHGTALGALFNKERDRNEQKVKKPHVRVSLRRPKPPPPKPPPEPPAPKPVEKKPEPKPEAKPKPKPKRKKVLRAKKVKKLTPKKPEPPAPVEAPKPTTPPPRKFAVNLQATISTGGIAVPTMEGGSSLVADASTAGNKTDKATPDTVEEKVKPADVTEVTKMPRILREPSPAELQKSYPEEARRLGLEGDVRLELLVSVKGRVIRSKVLKKAGNGFDKAARKLAKLFRFRPAMQGDNPVAVWIPRTFKFRLDL